jgi:hypothetical protein
VRRARTHGLHVTDIAAAAALAHTAGIGLSLLVPRARDDRSALSKAAKWGSAADRLDADRKAAVQAQADDEAARRRRRNRAFRKPQAGWDAEAEGEAESGRDSREEGGATLAGDATGAALTADPHDSAGAQAPVGQTSEAQRWLARAHKHKMRSRKVAALRWGASAAAGEAATAERGDDPADRSEQSGAAADAAVHRPPLAAAAAPSAASQPAHHDALLTPPRIGLAAAASPPAGPSGHASAAGGSVAMAASSLRMITPRRQLPALQLLQTDAVPSGPTAGSTPGPAAAGSADAASAHGHAAGPSLGIAFTPRGAVPVPGLQLHLRPAVSGLTDGLAQLPVTPSRHGTLAAGLPHQQQPYPGSARPMTAQMAVGASPRGVASIVAMKLSSALAASSALFQPALSLGAAGAADSRGAGRASPLRRAALPQESPPGHSNASDAVPASSAAAAAAVTVRAGGPTAASGAPHMQSLTPRAGAPQVRRTAAPTHPAGGATAGAGAARQSPLPPGAVALADQPDIHSAFLSRRERAAYRSRSEWALRLYHPLKVLLDEVGLPEERFHAWLRAKGLVVPTPQLVVESEEREWQLVAAMQARSMRADLIIKTLGRSQAGKVRRKNLLKSKGNSLWDKLRSHVHTDE